MTVVTQPVTIDGTSHRHIAASWLAVFTQKHVVTFPAELVLFTPRTLKKGNVSEVSWLLFMADDCTHRAC